MQKYTFLVSIGNEEPFYANPLFGDLKIKYAKETGEEFFRASIDGKIKFVGSDYTKIMDAPFDTVYNVKLTISSKTVSGEAIEKNIDCKFVKTNCIIDEDNKTIETGLDVVDKYESVLAGLDKEFDLISLAPEIQRVSLYKRPVVQLYIPGEKVIGCFKSGLYWEQECEAVTDLQTLNTDFGFTLTPKKLNLYYVKAFGNLFTKYNSTYAVERPSDLSTAVTIQTAFGNLRYTAQSELLTYYDSSSGNTYEAEHIYGSTGTVTQGFQFDGSAKNFANVRIDITKYDRSFVNRVLHDNDLYSGSKVNISGKSGFGDNKNYKYATPLDFTSFALNIFYSAEISEEPTKYGQRQPGEYYKKLTLPPSSGMGMLQPLCKSVWGDVSFWFNNDITRDTIDTEFRRKFILYHAYPLHSCISRILDKIGADVSFSKSPDCSTFFYEDLMGYGKSLFFTPATNILNGEYDRPAQKLTVTLKKILDMLKNCFKCYWYIDDDKLRIEHINYFINGHKYYTPNIGVDIASLTDPRTGKPWSFGKNTYEYNFDELPEYFQFSWADDCSEPFSGYPLEIKSNYVKKGQVESVNISGFSSDLDMMLLQPDNFNKDGVTLIATNSLYEVQYETITIGGNISDKETFVLQNGFLSMANLVRRYYMSDLPGSKIVYNRKQVNGPFGSNVESLYPFKVKRSKKQKIKIPCSLTLDPAPLIKTDLGTGQISEALLDLSSEVADVTILHNTESNLL